KWRAFVRAYVADPIEHGAPTRAMRAAGFNKNSKPATVGEDAYHLIRGERIIAAIAEETRKDFRAGHPGGARHLFNVVNDPAHKDHVRALAMVLDRCDPLETKHLVDVTHRTVDPDKEALEELRAARQLGATREKLLELFGANGLDRLEAMEAVEKAQRAAAAKVIEHNG